MTNENKSKLLEAYRIAVGNGESTIADLLEAAILDEMNGGIVLRSSGFTPVDLAPNPLLGYTFTCSGIEPCTRQTTEVTI